MVKKSQTNRTS